jgi:hypothetical protein
MGRAKQKLSLFFNAAVSHMEKLGANHAVSWWKIPTREQRPDKDVSENGQLLA